MDDYIATSITGLQLLTAFILDCIAIQVIHKKREKSVADLLILHLLITEFLAVIWNIAHCFHSLFTIKWIYFIIHKIVIATITFAAMQQIVCITADRVLAVALNLKYRVLVNKFHVIPVSVAIWLIASLCGIIGGYIMNANQYHMMWLTWIILTTVIISVSYIYIIAAVRRQRNRINPSNVTNSHQGIKYQVPLLISSSLIIFNIVPDALVYSNVVGFHNKWMAILYLTSAIFDPLVYVLHSKNVCCKQTINRVSPYQGGNLQIPAIIVHDE